MNLSIVGSGYVGTTLAACFAELGHNVVNIDIDEEIVETVNDGTPPIEEPGLAELFDEFVGTSLRATTDYDAARETDATFIALPTPTNDDGSNDTSIVAAGAEALAEVLATKDRAHTVVVKSTVIPGTTEEVVGSRFAEQPGVTLGEDLALAMNPEFLREGSAVEDFLEPDKLVFGTDHETAREVLHEIYAPLLARHDVPIVETGIREAEMIKYANNGFLAAKVSLINDIGNIFKELGVDAYEVADAIGLDDRIGASFLRSGLGWGGSCFPKDLAAIVEEAHRHDYTPDMLEAAIRVNDKQPRRLLALLDRHVDVTGRRVAVLGLSFKPGTDDIRNSRAIPVIEGLRERDADIVAYDPAAVDEMRQVYPDITYAPSAAATLDGASAALVVTEWPEIAGLSEEFDRMATPVVVDGRRAIDRRDGIVYEGLTW
jgi:UDPglucose 6-dehydrogenase